jgi:hypothetical protein
VLLLIGAVTGDFVNRKEFLNEEKKKKKICFQKNQKRFESNQPQD